MYPVLHIWNVTYVGVARCVLLCVRALPDTDWLVPVTVTRLWLCVCVCSVGLSANYCIEYFVRFYGVLSLIWLHFLVSLWRWYFSIASIDRPLLVTCNISMLSSMRHMECLFSIRCAANFDLFFYFRSRKCSWNRIRKELPVCPTYFILQSGHLSRYTPLFSYRLCVCV